jgi:hypothetical protein
MWPFPTRPPARPPQPDLLPELIKELELFSLDALAGMRRPPGWGGPTPLIKCSATEDQLATWMTWKAADNAWHEARLYRATLVGMWAAVVAAVAAIVAVGEGWQWQLLGSLPWTH